MTDLRAPDELLGLLSSWMPGDGAAVIGGPVVTLSYGGSLDVRPAMTGALVDARTWFDAVRGHRIPEDVWVRVATLLDGTRPCVHLLGVTLEGPGRPPGLLVGADAYRGPLAAVVRWHLAEDGAPAR